MDIVHLVGREPTLNMIYCGTKLMVTFELAARSYADVWQASLFEWVLRFLGPPQSSSSTPHDNLSAKNYVTSA